MTIGLTYHQLKALAPCRDKFDAVVATLGDAETWNGKSISANDARSAGVSFDNVLWAAKRVAKKDQDVERKLRLFTADCAAHVLHIYEKSEGADTRPREAIEATRKFANGEIGAAAWDAAGAAARDAARDAAGAADAAWSVAAAAARAAAGAADAARAAARAAAWAAWAASRDASWSAAGAAAAAWDAVWAAAWDADQKWQFSRLCDWLSADEPEVISLGKFNSGATK